MKKLLMALVLSIIAAGAIANDQRVEGHTRKDGTYVEPYQRTAPDSRMDNDYSSRGNMRPHTDQIGTRDPYAQPESRSAPDGQPEQPLRGGF